MDGPLKITEDLLKTTEFLSHRKTTKTNIYDVGQMKEKCLVSSILSLHCAKHKIDYKIFGFSMPCYSIINTICSL